MKVKTSKITNLFPTPFGRVEFEGFEDIHRRIVEFVHECEAQGKIRDSRVDVTSNWGNGFQIPLLREKVPVIEEFTQHIYQSFEGFLRSIGLGEIDADITADAWIVVSRTGGYNAPHIHPHGTFSSIYYVSIPERPSPQGYLELVNPLGSAALQSFGSTNQLVEPKEGTLMFFPSHLMHGVHPFEGEGERISLNFDYTIVQKDTDGSNPLRGIQRG